MSFGVVQGRDGVHQQQVQQQNSSSNNNKKKHLIVLCNGLWGRSKHWMTVRQALQETLERRQDHCEYHIHVSTANQLFDTYDGVDVCGSKLAKEVESVVDERFGRVSFIGHSMGGLIARNAIKKMYDEGSQTILGMEPCHFVTLATPHVGFVNHPQEDVPLARWIKGVMPFGSKILDRAVPFVTSYFLGEAGKQFFYRDDARILYEMSLEPWLEPLKSFKTRTLYANMTGDHLVGWGNSSIRSQEDIVAVEVDHGVRGLGVVREDPVEYAYASQHANANPVRQHASTNDAGCFQQQAMENLKSVGWRRIDVSFRDARLWYLSHQHIMVQRPAINNIGLATARHLAEQIYIMEKSLM